MRAVAEQAIVIGGGIIGLATCFELQDAGFKVTLIDPEPISGATHHAGGMLAPAAEVQFQQQTLVPLMNASARLYPGLIDRVSQVTDLPTGYRTDGTLVVGADRADAEHLHTLATLVGKDVHRLTSRQARAMEPALSPRISGAIGLPHDHQVAPRIFARALLDAIIKRGAEIITDRVVALEGSNPCVSVKCRKRVVEASTSIVVLSAGLGATSVDRGFNAPQLRLRPVYGDVVRVRVPVGLQPLITKVVRGFVEDRQIYLIPRDDGTLTIGATSREDSPHPRAGAVHDLLRDATRIVPGIEECEFLEATCGARPGTPDDLPYLGRAGSNLIISTGYFRHGILLAALGARVATQLAQHEELSPDLAVCDPFRHSRQPAEVQR